MVATWNVAASNAYYLRGAEYYLGSKEPDGVWYSPDGDLGRRDTAPVKSEEFARLYEGLDPSGRTLISNAGGRRFDRTPAFDITLSAPRSVSLIWAFADDEVRAAIEDAQERAAQRTLDLLSREAAYARRGRDGRSVEKVSLTAALFQHGESRPAEHADGRTFGDPNLHTHCVVLNLATRADGTIGALHSTVLRDWKMAAGAAYHAALAAELGSLGFGIDRIGKNGIFEIAGVRDADVAYFSARRSEIESELAEAGVQSAEAAALAAAVAKSTRSAKAGLSQGDRHDIWREAALANGVEIEGVDHVVRQAAHDIAAIDPQQTLRDRLDTLPRELTETESVIERRELCRAVAAALVGTGLPATHAEPELCKLLKAGTFVEIGKDAIGQTKYSTAEMIALERQLVDHAVHLAKSPWVKINTEEISVACRSAGLSAEQTDAARGATGQQSISIIEGAPGSGKTTMLQPIVDAYCEAGCRVVGAATAWRVAKALQDDLNIESRATASWLEGRNHGRQFLDARSVLIVDEAGLLSSREMHGLLSEARHAEAKVILVGDRRQLQAIGAGPGFGLAMRAVEASRVDTIIRQRQEWARQAVVAFGAGEAEAGLSAFAAHGCLQETTNYRSAVNSLAEEWFAQRQRSPDSAPLLIARTNTQIADLSHTVRERLKAVGGIRGPEVEVDAATPSGRTIPLTLAAGDEIRFLARHDGLGVINGSLARVSAVSERNGVVTIEARIDGRLVRFSPSDIADDQGRPRLGWAYASTVYGCQGITVERALVLLDAGYDRHAIHVAASRAREETRLILDTSSVDRMLGLNRPLDRVQDGHKPSPEERRAFLAERLTRAIIKSSTVATIEAAHSEIQSEREAASLSNSASHSAQARARERRRGLEHEF